MYRNMKAFSKILIFIVVFSMILIGCTPARRPITERERIDINQQRAHDLNIQNIANERINYPEYNMGYDNLPDNMGLNSSLERDIQRMAGIEEAIVVTDRDTAYIGLEPTDRYNMGNMRGLQSQVASRIRETAPQIERVYITSDMDRMDRMRDLRQRIINGTPASDLINELERLFS